MGPKVKLDIIGAYLAPGLSNIIFLRGGGGSFVIAKSSDSRKNPVLVFFPMTVSTSHAVEVFVVPVAVARKFPQANKKHTRTATTPVRFKSGINMFFSRSAAKVEGKSDARLRRCQRSNPR